MPPVWAPARRRAPCRRRLRSSGPASPRRPRCPRRWWRTRCGPAQRVTAHRPRVLEPGRPRGADVGRVDGNEVHVLAELPRQAGRCRHRRRRAPRRSSPAPEGRAPPLSARAGNAAGEHARCEREPPRRPARWIHAVDCPIGRLLTPGTMAAMDDVQRRPVRLLRHAVPSGRGRQLVSRASRSTNARSTATCRPS